MKFEDKPEPVQMVDRNLDILELTSDVDYSWIDMGDEIHIYIHESDEFDELDDIPFKIVKVIEKGNYRVGIRYIRNEEYNVYRLDVHEQNSGDLL